MDSNNITDYNMTDHLASFNTANRNTISDASTSFNTREVIEIIKIIELCSQVLQGDPVVATYLFYCNMDPVLGDIDLGNETGPPFLPLNGSTTLEVPIFLNVAGIAKVANAVTLYYNPQALQLLSVTASEEIIQGN